MPPNAPNPFRGGTTIRFELPREAHVRIVIYDVSGRVVATLVEGVLPAGRHAHAWNGRDDRGRTAVGGIFFLRMEANAEGERFTAKRRLVRLD